MIVTRTEAKRILEGRKSQHRLARSRRPPQVGISTTITYRRPNEALGYDAYGSPREEAIRVCHIEIVERWEDRCSAITMDDLIAEGWRDFDDFKRRWPDSRERVWVIRFELDGREYPRLLSDRIIAHHQGAYVENPARAMRGEGEAVDSFTQEEYSAAGRAADYHRERVRRETLERLSAPRQLELLTLEARSRHIDIRDELRALRRYPQTTAKQLANIRRKLDRTMALAETLV